MKRIVVSALTAAMLTLPAVAVTPVVEENFEVIGEVLYSNIVACIDGYPIQSFNIDGYTYIIAEDLLDYGFHVEWQEAERRLIVHKDRTARVKNYTADYAPTENKHTPGTPAFSIYATDISTWIGDTEVTGYNIGGYTCICMDDLAAHFAPDEESYTWDGEKDQLRLISRASRDAYWQSVVRIPGYSDDEAVDGEYAVWEFAVNAEDEIELVSMDGASTFVEYIRLSAFEIRIDVPYEQISKRNEDGYYYMGYNSKPHTCLAYRVLLENDMILQNSNNGGAIFRKSDGTSIFPEDYRSYVNDNPEIAEYLESLVPDLDKVFRVYINGKRIEGILTGPADRNTSRPHQHDDCHNLFFHFKKKYVIPDIDTIRIEMKLMDDYIVEGQE